VTVPQTSIASIQTTEPLGLVFSIGLDIPHNPCIYSRLQPKIAINMLSMENEAAVVAA
jgi:hypothetical protein